MPIGSNMPLTQLSAATRRDQSSRGWLARWFPNVAKNIQEEKEYATALEVLQKLIAERDEDNLRHRLSTFFDQEMGMGIFARRPMSEQDRTALLSSAIQSGQPQIVESIVGYMPGGVNATLYRSSWRGHGEQYSERRTPLLMEAIAVRSYDVALWLAQHPEVNIEARGETTSKFKGRDVSPLELVQEIGGMTDVVRVLAQRTAVLRRNDAERLETLVSSM